MNYEHRIKLEDEHKKLDDSLKVTNNGGAIVFGIVYVNYVFNNNEQDAHYKFYVKPAINYEADTKKKQVYQFTMDNFKSNIMNGNSVNFEFSKETPFTEIKIPFNKVIDNKIDIGVRTVLDNKNEISFASIDLTPVYEDGHFTNFVYGNRPKMIISATKPTLIAKTKYADNVFDIKQRNSSQNGYAPEFMFHNEIKSLKYQYGYNDDILALTLSKPIVNIVTAIENGAIINKDSITPKVTSLEDSFEEHYDDVLKFDINQKGKNTLFKSNFSTRFDDKKKKVINDEINGEKFLVENPLAKIQSKIKYEINVGTIKYTAIEDLKYANKLDSMFEIKSNSQLELNSTYVWERADFNNFDFENLTKLKEVIKNAKKAIT